MSRTEDNFGVVEGGSLLSDVTGVIYCCWCPLSSCCPLLLVSRWPVAIWSPNPLCCPILDFYLVLGKTVVRTFNLF